MSISSVSPAQVPQIASFTLPPMASDHAKRKRETTPANGMLIAGSVLAATGGAALIGGLSWYGIRKHVEAKALGKLPKTAALQAQQKVLDTAKKLVAAEAPAPRLTWDEHMRGLQQRVDAKTTIENGVYRERQEQQLCGLHALNTALYSLSGRNGDDFKAGERITVKQYLNEVLKLSDAETSESATAAAGIAKINETLPKGSAPITLHADGKFSVPKSALYQQGHLGHLKDLALSRPNLAAHVDEIEYRIDPNHPAVHQPFDFAAAKAGRENARALILLRGAASADTTGGHFTAVVRMRPYVNLPGNATRNSAQHQAGRWAIVDSQSDAIDFLAEDPQHPHESAWDALQSRIAAEPTATPDAAAVEGSQTAKLSAPRVPRESIRGVLVLR